MAESEAHVNVAASDPLATAERWRGEGRGVAVATVITTWGSSPRPVGSQLVLDEDGRFDRRGADRRLPWAGGRGIRHGEARGTGWTLDVRSSLPPQAADRPGKT